MAKQLTLIVAEQEGRVLLGMKKRGFGSGRWNGFGGKVEPGETIEQAAERELLEECGVTCEGLDKRAVLRFAFASDADDMEVHVFHTSRIIGNPVETDEMRPKWFNVDSIPYEEMWSDDRFWLPKFLAGECLSGHFYFDADEQTILSHDLRRVDKEALSC